MKIIYVMLLCINIVCVLIQHMYISTYILCNIIYIMSYNIYVYNTYVYVVYVIFIVYLSEQNTTTILFSFKRSFWETIKPYITDLSIYTDFIWELRTYKLEQY